MNILGIDTSSKACSCAVFNDDLLLSETYLNVGLTHSAVLMNLLENTLSNSGLSFSQIDKLVTTIGPGSYTGIRIGLSTIKGLAFERNLPCTGVSTLESLAFNLTAFNSTVCAVLDARVGQVFAALFSINQGIITRISDDAPMTIDELEKIIPENCMLCGDGAQLVANSLAHKNLICAPPHLVYQRASSAVLAAKEKPAETALQLVPNYHRKSQAERERDSRLK